MTRPFFKKTAFPNRINIPLTRKVPRISEGLLMLKVSVVEFLVSDDSCAERLPVTGAIYSKGAQLRGFPGIAGNHQLFFFSHNDLLVLQDS